MGHTDISRRRVLEATVGLCVSVPAIFCSGAAEAAMPSVTVVDTVSGPNFQAFGPKDLGIEVRFSRLGPHAAIANAELAPE